MRLIFLGLILFLCPLLMAQQIVQETWRINQIIGQNLNHLEEIILTRITNQEKESHVYGNTIGFNTKTKAFYTNYSAKCGNDCFRSSSGTYELLSKNQIRLRLSQYNQQGLCNKESKQLNLDLGVYKIVTKSYNQILLKRE